MLLLGHNDVAGLLTFPEYIEAVEQAFRRYAQGKTLPPLLSHIDVPCGEFHIKGGVLLDEEPVFAIKVNGGFFDNGRRFNLPSIQGLVLLISATNGSPLALMDSREITLQRTAAATAIAAKHLAVPESRTCTLCGAGNQSRAQLKAIRQALPIDEVFLWSRHSDHAAELASELDDQVQVTIVTEDQLAEALQRSDVCITCTASSEAFVTAEMVPPGMFIAAVGADSPEKQELDATILANAKVVTDLTIQAQFVGETHHALAQGLMTIEEVYAELGQIISGEKPGRQSDTEIIIFDSTGTYLQDAASASAIYAKALSMGIGRDWYPR
jgi:alanine dehydrogenase